MNQNQNGNNRSEVEVILQNFIESKYRKVLSIKGEWGVGKTYLVQNFLRIQKVDYYYGSVFGLSSIEQLKAQLLSGFTQEISVPEKSTISKKFVSSRENFSSFIAPLGKLLALLQRSSRIEKIPILGNVPLSENSFSVPVAGPVISLAGDLALNLLMRQMRSSVVCIDDLERTSKIPIEELLGFIDYLVQNLNCKVILIYNENYLLSDNPEAKKKLDDYREKVIDIEVELNPKTEEILNLVDFQEFTYVDTITKCLSSAKTNNIRVVHRLRWILKEVCQHTLGWEISLREQIIKNTIIIALAKFDKTFDIKIDETLDYLDITLAKKFTEKDAITKLKHGLILSNYGYRALGIDLEIVQFIQTGIINLGGFNKIGVSLNERELKTKIIGRLAEIDGLFRASFSSDESMIKEKLLSFVEKYSTELSIQEFEDVVELLANSVEMDVSLHKRRLLETLIRGSEKLQVLNSLRAKVDNFPDLRQLLEAKLILIRGERDITSALEKIYQSKAWSEEEAEYLNNCSVDDYYNWLVEGHSNLEELVHQAITISDNINQKIVDSIKRLASESYLNQQRAKKIYNITLDSPPKDG